SGSGNGEAGGPDPRRESLRADGGGRAYIRTGTSVMPATVPAAVAGRSTGLRRPTAVWPPTGRTRWTDVPRHHPRTTRGSLADHPAAAGGTVGWLASAARTMASASASSRPRARTVAAY